MYDNLPCYASRMNVTWEPISRERIRREINDSLIELDDDVRDGHEIPNGVLVLSVTQKDASWEDWLAVVEEYNNSTICATVSNHDSKRSCFLCCIPVQDNLR